MRKSGKRSLGALVGMVVLWFSGVALGEGVKPISVGAYFGSAPISADFTGRNHYPQSYAMWAGVVWLYKNKKDASDWVLETKAGMINRAMNEAKELALKNGNRYYAVENMHFQVVHTENVVTLYLDCNVIAWNP